MLLRIFYIYLFILKFKKIPRYVHCTVYLFPLHEQGPSISFEYDQSEFNLLHFKNRKKVLTPLPTRKGDH
jgi:hypothetical protein